MTGSGVVGTGSPAAAPPGAEGPRLAGVLPGMLGVLCFSGTAVATRVAGPVFGPVVLTCSRIVIAAALGMVTLTILRRWQWPGRKLLPSVLIAGLGMGVGYPLFLTLALVEAPAYHGAVVIGLVPAATALLAAARNRERLSGRFWFGCAVGFSAVLIFGLAESGFTVRLADLWLLAAVVSTAIGYVEGARVSAAIGAVPALCWAMILLAPFAAIVGIVAASAGDFGTISWSAWLGFGYAGVLSMFLGSVFWYRGLAAGGTGRIGQLNLAQPFLAIVWAALLLGEHIGWGVPVTVAIVLGCMVLCLGRPAEKPKPELDPVVR
ncbi:Permease of the drug/metabolite transporter (DMT) superfamily [Prauserella marina]|uniref:Permease of the drug/metabolite transporter (DMT) superfamily n=1 Tax=Prauserella marina TaxID=530584 RepID=A0A1G6TCQ8_9PSEU|nr:DMT family transporter [Prauserella marina]PWV75781.1 drug/metabolite transporter (DMT)-like permease [Prauserella marina]SDD26326.1 Permease of the drug/metabolite transporter (DMT) superfamily [Prauserella marina]